MSKMMRLGVPAMALLAAGLCPSAAEASSHREAPLISEDPSADNTDLYAFTSPGSPGTVTFLAMYIGLEEPGGGPNWLRFSDDVLYEIKIDNNGDGRANDVVYQFRFRTHYNPGGSNGLGGAQGPAGTFFYNVGPIADIPRPANFNNALVAQTLDVTRIVPGAPPVSLGVNLPVAPVYVGSFAYDNMPAAPDGPARVARADANYTRIWEQAISPLRNGATDAGRVFAGPTDDPFFVDLGAVFDDVTFRSSVAGFGSRGGGIDYVGGYNVHTIALQEPVAQLVRTGTTEALTDRGNVIGVYATASRPALTLRRNCRNSNLLGRPGRANIPCQEGYGQFVQVSRLGIPLVNEVLIPLALKDAWNAAAPIEDASIFGQFILAPSLPAYAQVLYGPMGVRAPAGYMAPSRSITDLNGNDMAQLVTGRIGALSLTLGGSGLVAPTGMTPADLLRLHVRTPASALPTNVGNPTLAMGRSRLGFAGLDTEGFPNGRRLFDDVVDIEERYVLNGLAAPGTANPGVSQLTINAIPFGDGVDGNDVAYRSTFPYVPIPLRGDAVLVHRAEPARGP
jgi:hypothetical protein